MRQTSKRKEITKGQHALFCFPTTTNSKERDNSLPVFIILYSIGIAMEEPILWTICNWIVAALNFGASLLCLFVFYCIMSNQKMRTNAFNLYVGFMIFPDALYAMTNGCLYLSKALSIPLFPPYEVTVYVYFVNFVVNFYSNGVVTHEINKLIQQSNNRQRTQ